MVHSVWFSMKSLREGERYFNKVLVSKARKKTLTKFFLFVLSYIWFFCIVGIVGYLLRTGQYNGYILNGVLEGTKLVID